MTEVGRSLGYKGIRQFNRDTTLQRLHLLCMRRERYSQCKSTVEGGIERPDWPPTAVTNRGKPHFVVLEEAGAFGNMQDLSSQVQGMLHCTAHVVLGWCEH